VDKISKENIVKTYSELFHGYHSLFLARNIGLSVRELKSIRAQFKKIDSTFMIAKNSLAKIALRESKFTAAKDLFFGPTAVVCSDNLVSASQLLVKICKENSKLYIAGGATDNKQLKKEDIIIISQMLTQNEIRVKILGIINASANKITNVLREPSNKIARLLRSYTEKQ
jgi:large subunit ribosomal protein L10